MRQKFGTATRKSQRILNLKSKEDDRNNPFHIHFELSESAQKKRGRRSSIENRRYNEYLKKVEYYRINYPGISYVYFSDDEEVD